MRDPSILKKFSQEKKGGPVIFTGDLCKVRILEKFENYGCLRVTDVVNTLGVFDMEVDGKTSGMFLVGHIEMHPSDIDTVEIDDNKYVELTFRKGDTFMVTTNTVKDALSAFAVYVMYIKYKNVMAAMSYEDQATIFDRIKKTCGLGFDVDHVIYELIFAHLSRDPDDFTVPYRNTDMNSDFIRINLSDVTHASRSTSSRVVGAYFADGINAAIVNPNTAHSPIEDLLRQ